MLEWIVSSSILIAVIIALRYILRGKISLRLQYALWALVLLRLLVPISFGNTGLSVMNAVPRNISERVLSIGIPRDAYTLPEEAAPELLSPFAPVHPVKEVPVSDGTYSGGVSNVTMRVTNWGSIAKTVWLSGIVIAGFWLLISNLRLASRLKKSRRALGMEKYTIPVYITDAVETPCLFGLFRPAIYITPEAAAEDTILRHTIEHERTHFHHGDHIWSLLRGVCLALHWYNPLVWWAALLSRRDSELACDEATIKRIGENERAEYGRTLIQMSCQKRPALLLTATTMTGSKSSIKERITLIAKKPKMAVYTLVAVVLIAAVAVGCTFTGANEGKTTDADQTLYNCDGLTVAIPNEYVDRLYFPDSLWENELIRVYEKQSYEESRADWGEDAYAGFLFSIVRYSPAQHERYLSSDGSGLTFFAKDDDYYYGHGYATDVQFYRSDIDIYTEDSFAPWNELTDAVDGILNDFVIRNGLNAYSDNEFWNSEFTYDSAHVYVTYYPYYSVNGSKDVRYILVLSQPAAQGDGGIWCVERWYDDNATPYYYFPSRNGQTDLPAADYFVQLQAECDDGHRPGLLDPIQVAMEFAMSYFDHTPTLDSFEFIEGKPKGNVSALCNDLFASGDIELTLNLAGDGAYNTYPAGEWYLRRFDVLLSGYEWTRLDMPLTEPSDFWLTAVSADGTRSMTFWSNSGAGMVQYSDGNTTTFWSASPSYDNSISIAEDIRFEYDNLDVNYARISFYLDSSAEDAAAYFVSSAYGSHMTSLTPGNMYGMSDYDVVKWEVREVSADSDAVVGWFICAFIPWDFNSSGIWAGNTAEGTGEYEGKLTFYREFVLQRQNDGYWRCIDFGTGGASLPE